MEGAGDTDRLSSLRDELPSDGKPRSFSGTARVEKGVPKGPDVFLHCPECPVHVEVLKKHTHVVAFRVGPRNLVQALQPIPHQLRLAQLIHQGVFALSGLFLSIFRHRHLLI
jgi:hypothetical protein